MRLEKSALFNPSQAVSCLSLLHVSGLPESPPGQNRLHALNTFIDLTSTEQVGSHIKLIRRINPCMPRSLNRDASLQRWHKSQLEHLHEHTSAQRVFRSANPILQVCAAGALLSILHRGGLLRRPPSASLAAPCPVSASLASSALRRRSGDDPDVHFWVECASELHLLGHLCVDSASMHALQIFQVPLPYCPFMLYQWHQLCSKLSWIAST